MPDFGFWLSFPVPDFGFWLIPVPDFDFFTFLRESHVGEGVGCVSIHLSSNAGGELNGNAIELSLRGSSQRRTSNYFFSPPSSHSKKSGAIAR